MFGVITTSVATQRKSSQSFVAEDISEYHTTYY